jgi:hypothetical protein
VPSASGRSSSISPSNQVWTARGSARTGAGCAASAGRPAGMVSAIDADAVSGRAGSWPGGARGPRRAGLRSAAARTRCYRPCHIARAARGPRPSAWHGVARGTMAATRRWRRVIEGRLRDVVAGRVPRSPDGARVLISLARFSLSLWRSVDLATFSLTCRAARFRMALMRVICSGRPPLSDGRSPSQNGGKAVAWWSPEPWGSGAG